MAKRILNRDHLHAFDVEAELGTNEEIQTNAEAKTDRFVEEELGRTVFKDEPEISLYSIIKGEGDKKHQKVRAMDGLKAEEITNFPDTIISDTLTKKRRLIRYYFLTREKRDDAKKAMMGR